MKASAFLRQNYLKQSTQSRFMFFKYTVLIRILHSLTYHLPKIINKVKYHTGCAIINSWSLIFHGYFINWRCYIGCFSVLKIKKWHFKKQRIGINLPYKTSSSHWFQNLNQMKIIVSALYDHTIHSTTE